MDDKPYFDEAADELFYFIRSYTRGGEEFELLKLEFRRLLGNAIEKFWQTTPGNPARPEMSRPCNSWIAADRCSHCCVVRVDDALSMCVICRSEFTPITVCAWFKGWQ